MDSLESIKQITLETLKNLAGEIDASLLPDDEMVLEIIEIISKNSVGQSKAATDIDKLIRDFVKANQVS